MLRYASARTFQFHKGTIKPDTTAAELSAEADFNSIKVRLNHVRHPRQYLPALISIP